LPGDSSWSGAVAVGVAVVAVPGWVIHWMRLSGIAWIVIAEGFAAELAEAGLVATVDDDLVVGVRDGRLAAE
jgi:hypothetical protein